MKGLGVPVHNAYGLRPALLKRTTEIAPLTASATSIALAS
jgi:hypothetical protein